MNKAVHLRTFSPDELILNEQQTRVVLTFFWPEHERRISDAGMSDNLRSFAQGLLVEAIDATYSMGYVHALFKALVAGILPTERANATVRVIKSFAEEASSHWFKHATVHDLVKVQIYETVRRTMSNSFRKTFEMKLNGIAENGSATAFVNYACVFYQSNLYWG